MIGKYQWLTIVKTHGWTSLKMHNYSNLCMQSTSHYFITTCPPVSQTAKSLNGTILCSSIWYDRGLWVIISLWIWFIRVPNYFVHKLLASKHESDNRISLNLKQLQIRFFRHMLRSPQDLHVLIMSASNMASLLWTGSKLFGAICRRVWRRLFHIGRHRYWTCNENAQICLRYK